MQTHIVVRHFDAKKNTRFRRHDGIEWCVLDGKKRSGNALRGDNAIESDILRAVKDWHSLKFVKKYGN